MLLVHLPELGAHKKPEPHLLGEWEHTSHMTYSSWVVPPTLGGTIPDSTLCMREKHLLVVLMEAMVPSCAPWLGGTGRPREVQMAWTARAWSSL